MKDRFYFILDNFYFILDNLNAIPGCLTIVLYLLYVISTKVEKSHGFLY